MSRRCGRDTAAGIAARSTAASTALAAYWPARPAVVTSSGTSGGTATPTPAAVPCRRPAPRPARRGDDRPRVKGESYKVDLYEAAIGRALEHVAVSARLKVATVASATRPDPDGGDALALARITRERDQAALRFAKDRDLGRLEATMARLDAGAAAAVVRPSRTPTAAEARTYLESLPNLWAKTSAVGRHAIAEAVFERIDVLGGTDYTFTLTAHAKAHGWDAAFGAGDQSISIGQSGRGERDSPSRTQRPGPFLLINRTKPREAASGVRRA